jgi:drug/metabolite transporter (DMT)-like permease
MIKPKITLGGTEALLGAAFLFAITNVLVRVMASMWGTQAQVAVRFALVWVILIIYSLVRKNTRKVIPSSKLLPAVAYSLLASAAILFFTISVQKTAIANTLFTSNAAEISVAFLLGTILLREKLTIRKIIAIILGLAGLALYSHSIFAGSIGIIFGLLGGATTALCNLLAKRLKGVDTSAIMRMQFGVGAIFMIILTLLFSPHDIIRTVSIWPILATILFAIILIAATRMVLYGFQHSDINIASVILSSQLPFGALLGFFIYQEVLGTNVLISGLLILGAAVIGGIGQKATTRDVQVHS